METTPIFGTYYHQNRVFTTNDLGLENVEDDLGRDSPIKYEKITNFPFYGSDSFSLDQERGDIGYNSEITGDLLVLPNTIKPYPNDYFTLQSIGEQYYFKVINATMDMIKAKPFYRINFRFSKVIGKDSIKHIEDQVIEEYTTIYNNIGTDNNCIIKSSVFSIIDYMQKLAKKLKTFYIKNYYNMNNNVIIFHNDYFDVDIYNRYLNQFIIDNDLFYDANDFYSTVKLIENIPTPPEFQANYEKTIYYALESRSNVQLTDYFYSFMDINYRHTSWIRSNIEYKDLVFISDYDNYYMKSDKILQFLSKKFYGKIKLNTKFVANKDYYMENLIIDYINNDLEMPDKETLDYINNNIWRKDMRSYVFIPLLLYIFKKCENTEIHQL
jgi:hypothetical protein